MWFYRFKNVAIVVLLLFVVVNCTSDENGPEETLEEPNTFEKPSLYQYDSDEFFYRLEQQEINPAFTKGSGAVHLSRDPITQTKRGQALWLYEDDPFVMDFGYTAFRDEDVDEVMTYDIMVLLDYEPVEFTIQEFHNKEAIPATDELMENSEFETTQGIEIETNAGFHTFSLAIPADSFPEKAAYDMRIISIARLEPDDDATVMTEEEFSYGLSFSVFYGSTEVRDEGLSKPYNEELILPSTIENFLMSRSRNRIFIKPPEDVYNINVDSQNDLRLGQAFEVDEPNPDVYGLARYHAPSGEADRSMIMAFDGTEVLEEPFGVIEIPEQRSFVEEDPDPYVVKMPMDLDIESSEEPHTLRIMRFDHPLERRMYDIDEDRGFPLYRPSPPLFLQRAEN